MGRRRSQTTILLDWVNIRYSTALIVVAGLTTVVLGAGGSWYYLTHRDPQRGAARRAIQEASDTVLQAASQDLTESYLASLVDHARAHLGRAREAFERSDYTDALDAADEARQSALAVLHAGQSAEANQEVRFYRLEGDVKVKRAKRFDWEDAAPETVLRPGDQVKTSSTGGAQIIYFDGAITTIKPGSLLEIKQLYQNPTTKVQKVAEKLNWGSLTANTQAVSAPGSFHEVTTETSRARSTSAAEFDVAFDAENGRASVDLYSGSLEVSAGDDPGTAVNAGERVLLAKGQVVGRTNLLPAPGLVSPGDQWTFNHPEPEKATTTLQWEPIAGARHYHLQVAEGSLFSRSVIDRRDLGETLADVEGLMPGTYFWRVAGRDPDGASGAWSPARKFRIISKRLGPTNDVTPPLLTLDEFIQAGPMIILAGTTEPGAQLWVSSHGTTKRVDVDVSGRFTTVIKLTREGKNQLQIRAQDSAGNESLVSRVAAVYAY